MQPTFNRTFIENWSLLVFDQILLRCYCNFKDDFRFVTLSWIIFLVQLGCSFSIKSCLFVDFYTETSKFGYTTIQMLTEKIPWIHWHVLHLCSNVYYSLVLSPDVAKIVHSLFYLFNIITIAQPYIGSSQFRFTSYCHIYIYIYCISIFIVVMFYCNICVWSHVVVRK